MDETLKVNDFNYCETTRNVDNMLNQFSNDRKVVVSLVKNNINKLITDLWTFCSPICYDPKCLFNMNQNHKSNSLENRIEGIISVNEGIINYHSCAQCVNMKRLIDFRQTKIGDPFTIECGSSTGNQLVLTESKISKLFILKESPPKAVRRALNNPYINKYNNCSKSGCGVSYSEIDYVGLDPFSNNLLINWTLNDFLEKQCMPNILKMHTGFICSDNGYSLYEHPDIGRVRHLQEYPEYLEHIGNPSPTAKAADKIPISNSVVKGVIMQLFATLHTLRQFDFSHGGPSSRSILFKKDVCSYLYDGVHVEGPLTIKICDLNHSGITVNKQRLYNKSVVADQELLKKPFKPIIDTVTIKPFSFDKSNRETISIYRLKDPNKYIQEAMLFMYIKHLGLPIYQSSFDAYGFMISLMADRSFYATVMSDESMYLLWRGMWLEEEFETMQDKMQRLHLSHDPVTRVDKVLRILAGFGLRCDMIDKGWEMIKTW